MLFYNNIKISDWWIVLRTTQWNLHHARPRQTRKQSLWICTKKCGILFRFGSCAKFSEISVPEKGIGRFVENCVVESVPWCSSRNFNWYDFFWNLKFSFHFPLPFIILLLLLPYLYFILLFPCTFYCYFLCSCFVLQILADILISFRCFHWPIFSSPF